MAYDRFDNFSLHKVSTEYQSNNFSMTMGGGYSFDTDGSFPPLRIFNLKFTGFRYYVNSDGEVDAEINKDINNMKALEDFYRDHLTHKTFIYNHPVYGDVKVRFKDPLNIPEGITGAGGVLESFDVKLKEVFA